MKRVLRSSTLHKREKGLLDLNKEPCENRGFLSDSDSSADCVSAGGNVGEIRSVSHPSECEKDADSSIEMCLPAASVADDLGNGRNGGMGENADGRESGDAVEATGFEPKCELISSCPTKEGMCESQPSGYARDTAGVFNENISSGSGACANGGAPGKGRRGRKRKMIGIPSTQGASKKDAVKELVHLSSVQNGVEEKSSGSAECLKLVKTENVRESIVEEISEHAEKVGDLGANMIGDAAGNTNKDRQEFRNSRRGRKRKIVESVEDNKDNQVIGMKAEKLALDGKPQIVGRLLRSRTMATTDGEKQAYGKENVGFAGIQVKQEIAVSEKKKIKMETYGRARVSQKDAKVLKGRRGRPPKLRAESENSKVIVNEKVKSGSQKNIKLPRAGNSVKDSTDGGSSKFLDNKRKRTKKHKNKKEGDLGRREEQQLVRDEIISLIKKVGWTIDYRRRIGREYNDAVYVDWDGKTYWSVTLAYKSLKEKVENGTADVRATSAFTPISEDKLSTLLRVRKEKKGKHQKKQKVENRTGKQVTKVKLKRSAVKCPVVSECNENLNSRLDVSSTKKTKTDTCEEGSSMVASCRGRPRSNSLMARGSENGLCPYGDGLVLYEGKLSLLSWMIDLGTVPLGVKVKYMNQRRTSVMLEGKIDREGVCCGCCNKIFTLSDFESHAGSKLCQPFNNIFLESGPSLLQCLKDSWGKQEQTDDIGFHLVDVNSGDTNDDTCNICGDGGNLICCDGCPSTFHQSCLQIPKCPPGDWHCIYCSCKFCGMVGGKAYRRDDLPDTDDSALLVCLFCEEKFHVSCMLGNDSPHVNCGGLSFCGKGCQKLFERLEMLLGVRHELEEGFSWTIIRRQDVKEDAAHSSVSSKVECNSKLAIAFSIMDECFLPIIDLRSKISMVPSVIYSCGSNFRRLNYSSFYTCILERGDELVSAAAIRIHGNQLAEMPFIGTRYMYRRQGMCRRLLRAIEMYPIGICKFLVLLRGLDSAMYRLILKPTGSVVQILTLHPTQALSSLEVEKLVIPAISELNETWTKVFGFLPVEESVRQEMKYTSMIVFPGIDMLQKLLCKSQISQGDITTAAGTELSQLPIEDVKGSSNPGPDSDAPEVMLQRHDDESTASVGSGARGHDGSLKDGPESTNALHLPEAGMTRASAESGYVTGFSCAEISKFNFNLNQASACQVESNSLTSSSKGTLELNNMEKIYCVPEDGKEALRCQNKKQNVIDISDAPHSDISFQRDALKVLEPGLVNHEAEPNSLNGVSLPNDSHLSSKGVVDCSSVGYSGNTFYNCESLCNLSTHSDVTCLATPGNTSTCSVTEGQTL